MKIRIVIFILFTSKAIVSAQGLQELVFSGGKNFVGKDVLQLEYGTNFEKQIKSISSVDHQISQYALIKYGIRLDLDFVVSYNIARNQVLVSDQMRRSNGLSNLTAGFKKKLNKNYSFQSNIGFSKDVLGGTLGSFQILAISEHMVDSFLSWENNLGLNWANGNPEANLMYLSGLTFTIPYPLDFIIEFYGQYGIDSWNNYSNAGFGYYFNRDLMLEAYIGYANSFNQQSTFLSLNFYWRLVPERYNENN